MGWVGWVPLDRRDPPLRGSTASGVCAWQRPTSCRAAAHASLRVSSRHRARTETLGRASRNARERRAETFGHALFSVTERPVTATWGMMMALEATPGSVETVDPIGALVRAGAFRDAVALCAREHGAALGRLCMAMLGSQAEADETVQESLIAAHDGMAQWRGEASIRAWLFGIARRMCARRLETRGRQERRLRLVHDADADARLPDEVVEARRRAVKVRAALEQLKPSERDVVLLRYESGLSFREIAVVCGIDEAAARKRASRALEGLRSLLSDEASR